jgi:hypothetical protein
VAGLDLGRLRVLSSTVSVITGLHGHSLSVLAIGLGVFADPVFASSAPTRPGATLSATVMATILRHQPPDPWQRLAR